MKKPMNPWWKGFWWGVLTGTLVGRGIVIILTYLGMVVYLSLTQ